MNYSRAFEIPGACLRKNNFGMESNMQVWLARLKDFIHYKDLLKHLVMRDIKLKYRRSVLGYLWSILDPLFTMIVMTVVFSKMFNKNIENFPVYLFCGQLLFNYMKNSTGQAMNSINTNGALIKKAYVPKYIFSFSKSISSLIDMLFTMIALFLVMVATGASFSIWNLLFPFVLFQLFVFSLGLGLFLAQANVFFRDVQHIYNAVMLAWMYLTPIFYPVESLPSTVQYAVTHFNPVYYYVKQFRDIIYLGIPPQGKYIFAGVVAALLMLVFGTGMFLKNQDRFILHI